MRLALSQEAERSGRSMNAEIVARIDASFQEFLSLEGLVQMSKRIDASVHALEGLFFDVWDTDLEAFIEDQQSKGTMLTRSQAIRLILRSYLSEKGFARPRGQTRASEKKSPPA
jgi:hypothetical protein